MVLLIAALVPACSSSGGGGSTAGAGSRASTPPASSAAAKALDASATQLRAQVEQLATPLKAVSDPQLLTGANYLKMDDAGPCRITSDAAWPQRWAYGVVLRYKGTNPVATVGILKAGLTVAGWRIVRTYDTPPDSVDFDARKGGMQLEIAGEPNPSIIKIDGYGPCIGADGKPVA